MTYFTDRLILRESTGRMLTSRVPKMSRFTKSLAMSGMLFCLCVWSLPEAQAQQGRTGGGGTGGGAGGGATRTGGQQTTNQPRAGGGGGRTGDPASATGAGATNADGTINTEAGSSAGVLREFGDGFIGRGDNDGRFVGSQQATTQQSNRQTPNFQQRQSTASQGGKPSFESKIRPVIRLGFDHSRFASSRESENASEMIRTNLEMASRMQRAEQFAGVQISLDASARHVLEGSVRSEQERRLAEAYLRLEPGVRAVDNRLVVIPVK